MIIASGKPYKRFPFRITGTSTCNCGVAKQLERNVTRIHHLSLLVIVNH